MKTTIALLATAGMLTAPLALAQDSDPASTNTPTEQALPNSGGSPGLTDALGVSNTVLAVGAGAALAVAIGVAIDSDSGTGTTGTTGPTGTN